MEASAKPSRGGRELEYSLTSRAEFLATFDESSRAKPQVELKTKLTSFTTYKNARGCVISSTKVPSLWWKKKKRKKIARELIFFDELS